MARDPKYVSVGLLTDAIEQARPLLRWPIESVDRKRSFIRVRTPDEAIYFYIEASHDVEIDQTTGKETYLLGGDSYRLVLVSKGDSAEAEAEALWRGAVPPHRSVRSMIQNKTTVFAAAVAMLIAFTAFAFGLWFRSQL
jgi:hypothetical protein